MAVETRRFGGVEVLVLISIFVLLVAVVVGIVIPPTMESGPYQIVTMSQLEDASGQVFLLDTSTGVSWVYRRIQGGSERKWHPVGWNVEGTDGPTAPRGPLTFVPVEAAK